MDGYSQHRASGYLGHATSCQLVLSLLTNVDVAGDLGSSTRVNNVLGDLRVADDGGILLAWRDGSAVAGNIRVDYDTSVQNRVEVIVREHTQETLACT
jgi:hypothetical protein